MKYRLKLLLLMLLLTLPLRGFAAATAYGEPARHDDGISALHHAGIGATAANQHNADATSYSGHHQERTDNNAAECSVCSDCCTGAMPGSSYGGALTDTAPTARINVFIDRLHAGFIPDGPERPPRTALC